MQAKNRSTAHKEVGTEAIRSLKKKLIVANKILEMEKMATPFGHISVRIPGTENFLITRSVAPGEAAMDDILVCDARGKIIQGKREAMAVHGNGPTTSGN